MMHLLTQIYYFCKNKRLCLVTNDQKDKDIILHEPKNSLKRYNL